MYILHTSSYSKTISQEVVKGKFLKLITVWSSKKSFDGGRGRYVMIKLIRQEDISCWSVTVTLQVCRESFSHLLISDDVTGECQEKKSRIPKAESVRLMYWSVHDNRDSASETALSPPPPSSLTHVHWCIGYRNPNSVNKTRHSLSKSSYVGLVIGLVVLRGPIHRCACVSEERGDGEGVGS